MSGRIESLFLVFCGLVLLILVMKPTTETFFSRIFPRWFKAFLFALLQALFVSLMLFGILGIFSKRGVHLIHHPILFMVVSGIGTALFLWGNFPGSGVGSSLWPPDFPVRRKTGGPTE
jgi:hypothetical protein